MAADRPTEELLNRLLAAAAGDADRRTERLVIEAAAEAEAEVKELLRSALTAALLRQAVAKLEGKTSSPGLTETAQQPEQQIDSSASASELGACYLYCITDSQPQPRLDTVAAVDSDYPLQIIADDGLQLIASLVPLDMFDATAVEARVKRANRATDLEWIDHAVRAHDRVIKSALKTGPVIPLRFGTVVRNEVDARRLLESHRRDLLATLDALRGKTEWGVKMLMREDAVAGHSARADDLAERENLSSSGKTYLLERRRAGEVRAQTRRFAREVAQDCEHRLSALAVESIQLPLQRRTLEAARADCAGASLGEPKLVMNAAFLVRDEQAEQFAEIAKQLARQCAPQGFDIELTGPWPAYNFVRNDLLIDIEEAA